MKRKFSSMGRVAIALVLVVSLGVVMAGPAAVMGQGSSNYAEYALVDAGSGNAYWDDAEARSGKYSVRLYPGTVDWVDWAGVQIASGEALTDFSTTGIGEEAVLDVSQTNFYYNIEDEVLGQVPIVAFVFEEAEEGIDWKLVLAPELPTFETGTGEWVKLTESFTTGHLVKYDGEAYVHWTAGANWGAPPPIFEELGWWQSDATDSPIDGMTVDYVEVSIGMELATIFVDDVAINGVTYDLQPPFFMDAYYYQTGDTVMVTLIDEVVNISETVRESVAAWVYNEDTYQEIVIALQETGVDTGVFVGTFDLVGTTPGTGELLVSHGDEIYMECWDGDYYEEYAYIDNVAPVVEITAPADADFVAGAVVLIEGTYVEDNEDTVVLTIGGTEVGGPYGEGSVDYTWDTTEEAGEPLVAVWPDGAYTIEVVATDLGGLVGSDSISVTVDNTEPSITGAAATPPTILPAIEAEVTFSASIIDAGSDITSVEISGIPGVGTLTMLDEDADDIYTVAANITASEANYTLTITATDTVDVGDANVNTDTITLVVATDIVPPVITSSAITYEYGSSAQPGDTVIILANVTDDVGMGTVTAECDVVTDGGEPPVPLVIALLDDGEIDDATADDGIYTATVTVDDPVGWGDYTVTITATDAKENEAIDDSLILAIRSGATGVPIVLVEGWNLISLPLIPVNSDITAVISTLTVASGNVSSVGIVWGYDPATEFSYYMPATGGDLTEMEDGVGYWVFMEEADTLTITGREWPVPPEVPPVYSVVEGWNLIGVKSIHPIHYALYLGNLYEYGEVPLFSVIWGYGAVAGRYFSVYPMHDVTDLFPGHGYWLWMKVNGTIVPPQ